VSDLVLDASLALQLFLEDETGRQYGLSVLVVAGWTCAGLFFASGKSAATVIPPAFGLPGVNLHTSTGWGSVPYWNAFVANLEMHGQGNFYDPRLDNAKQFPIAAKNHFGHVHSDNDMVSSKLAGLHLYQLSIPAPVPPPDSYNKDAAKRGLVLFSGKAQCSNCHQPGTFTDSGWNLHTPKEVRIDGFQANRAPDHRYRTSPLMMKKQIWCSTSSRFPQTWRSPSTKLGSHCKWAYCDLRLLLRVCHGTAAEHCSGGRPYIHLLPGLRLVGTPLRRLKADERKTHISSL
jgi:hypothetical protein